MKSATFLTAIEIAKILGVSRSTGYKIVSILNNELKDKGYIIVPGRVSKKYFCTCQQILDTKIKKLYDIKMI